jgi:hypothetical protein
VIAAAVPADHSTTRSGSTRCSREPTAVPSTLPTPAAPATAPRASVPCQPPSTVAWTRNAEKIVRNPPSPRSAALARRATTTRGFTGRRRRPVATGCGAVDKTSAGSSPVGTSTWCGSRTASTAPQPNTAAVAHSSQGKPSAQASPAPIPPKTPAVSRPNTDVRALAEVSDIAPGSTRGITAARSTLCALNSTSTPSAAG